jgi:hypothetical protein
MYASKAVQKGALIIVKNNVENVNAHTLKSRCGATPAREFRNAGVCDLTSATSCTLKVWTKVSNRTVKSVRVKSGASSGEYVLDNNNKSAQTTPHFTQAPRVLRPESYMVYYRERTPQR